MTWQPYGWRHHPHFTTEGVEILSGQRTCRGSALKWLSQGGNPATMTRFCWLPLSRVAHESEALGELLAYLLYTFLMNRPLGLIKGKKRLIIFPNSCKLFTFHLCWWLIKEQRSMETAQSGCNSSRVHNEALVWMPMCEQGWAHCHIQTCSRQRVFPGLDSTFRNRFQGFIVSHC